MGCEKFLEDRESAEPSRDSVGWLALGSLMVFASHEARSTSAGPWVCLSSLWLIRGLGESVGVDREEGLRSVPFPSLCGIRVCGVCPDGSGVRLPLTVASGQTTALHS